MTKPFNGARFLFLIYLILICTMMTLIVADVEKSNVTVKVGVVLDMTEVSEKMSFLSIVLALQDFYKSNQNYQTRIVLHTRDSQREVVSATAAALDLMMYDEVEAIIGPSTSKQANFMISLGDKAQVPIISYYTTSPLLSSIRNPYYFRATHNDSTQVKAISSLVQEFGWREVVAIHGENEFGEGIVPFLTDALQEINCRVHNRSVISLNATNADIKSELYSLINTGKRVFIVHLVDSLAVRLFENANEIGMMDRGYAWIVTNEIGNRFDNKNLTILNTMQGILGIKNYMPSSQELDNFTSRWYKEFRSRNPTYFQNAELDTFGIWAHDAAVALAMAIDKVFGSGEENLFGYQRNNVTVNATNLDILGVSKAGPKLRDALSNISFNGFAGNFSFVNGEIPPTAFQIVNVVGNGGRGVGFWTPNGGLTRDLSFSRTKTALESNLGVIIWPGDTASPPKGWVVPKDGKKLRVGVPMKGGFFEFVKVTGDPHATKVTGYCIEVFQAVMKAMTYSVLYEYIPFALPNGSSTGSYNDLTYQVALGNFDAVVGDVTIVANRTLYIDYTLPYTESGASLLVPLKDPIKRSSLIFLKPLTGTLWGATSAVFLIIASVVWILEREANNDIKGTSLLYQNGTVLWFSFSIMVFAQKEKTVNNLTRMVLAFWFFVVLILTQTYTASLTSMMTVQRLQPVTTDIKDLTSGGHYVGYQRGSYVLGILMNPDSRYMILSKHCMPR
ncbi:unnamed protein product [Rhodiola kirilowii]